MCRDRSPNCGGGDGSHELLAHLAAVGAERGPVAVQRKVARSGSRSARVSSSRRSSRGNRLAAHADSRLAAAAWYRSKTGRRRGVMSSSE